MFSRMQYLYSEGFEVVAVTAYNDKEGPHNARLTYFEKEPDGNIRLRSEHFTVNSTQMEHCCALFFAQYTPHS
jgi:hypothetical protein